MNNKLYDKFKKFIKENILSFLITFTIALILFLPLPYYINTPKGIMNVSDKISVSDAYLSKGSFNLAYVNQIECNVTTWLYSLINKDWDLVKKEEPKIMEMNEYYDHLSLDEAITNATIVAYNLAKKDVEVIDSHYYVGYIDESSKTDLKIKDELIKINDIPITSTDTVTNIVKDLNVGDEVKIEVINDNKTYIRTATIYEDNRKLIGIGILSSKDLKTDPKLKVSFNPLESGPSGGLMMALEIYNQLTEEDITKGYKIAGTGTIDEDGTVGSISGIKYKLKGAVNEKTQIFLAPAGENYEEAIKLKKQNNYKIEIVSISNINEAIAYLEELD